MNIVAILANGVGSRFGSNIPKQFHKVNGKMVIEYVIESILSSKNTDKIVIASNLETNSVYLADICSNSNIDLIEGGNTRNQTLNKVITYIKNNYDCNSLIVCDAVRPMVTSDVIDKYFSFLDDNDAVVTAQKITDSLGCFDFKEIDRERYYLMQSPEGFNFNLLADNFDENSKLTEVTQQLPDDSKIKLYFDFNNNFKLTYPADLKYLEALIKDRDNVVDLTAIINNVTRLKSYLEVNYPNESQAWIETLQQKIPELLKSWQIENYKVIKTSHFGIIFIADSIKYGKCVLKIIPPFIDRYDSERSCYQSINSNIMCEMYDYDDSCCALLLEQCDDVNLCFDTNDKTVLSFFTKVINSCKTSFDDSSFKDYKSVLINKLNETDFDYKNDLIMAYVKKAVDEYNNVFANSNTALIHGDLHRYNIMSKNNSLVAIDPIGYIAPKEFDIARYIGTELTDNNCDIILSMHNMINYFSSIVDENKLKSALFIDIVFRLHNSLFENHNYKLTDKWLDILKILNN
jgi:2-C-methyl-D-erythritol 4-phosphate cytidylyltransferase